MTFNDMLKKIGIPEETIDFYLESKMIIHDKGGIYKVVDGDLLITLITECLNNKIDPTIMILPEKSDVLNELDIVYTNILNNNFILAAEACELIKRKVNTYQLDLLINACRKHKDINNYILKESEYGNNLTIKMGIQKIERRFLLELFLFDYSKAIKTLKLLDEIYKNYNTVFTHNCANLFRIIAEFNKDYLAVGNSTDETLDGPSSMVFKKLIESDDIYRADDLIQEERRKNPNSIEWQAYLALMIEIKNLNEKNLKNALNRSIIDYGILETNEYVFPSNPFPRITKEDLARMDEQNEILEDKVDYYKKYEDALFEGNYDLAKEMLLKYEKHVAIEYGDENFDYLEEEIDILVKNKNLGVNMKEYNTALQFAMNYMNIGNYKLAKNYAAKCFNLLEVKNSRLLCMLGKIYNETGDKKKAEYFYDEALKNRVSPFDLTEIAELYLENRKYKKVIKATERFDYYIKSDNTKLHYMAASAYLHLKMFEDSLSEIETCTNILEGNECLPIMFAEEREIIEKAEEGYNKTFDLDDYVEYSLDEEESELKENIEYNVEIAYGLIDDISNKISNNYAEDMKYLLSVTKILFQAYKYDDAIELVKQIEEIYDESKLSNEDAKKLTKMLNNFSKI